MKKSNIVLLVLSFTICGLGAPVIAQEAGGSTYYVRGEVTTGYNISKGRIMYDLGGVVGAQGFNYVFAYKPNSNEPGVITSETPEETLLATGIDQGFYDALGIDSGAIDPEVVNLPFRDLPVTVDGNTSDPDKAKARLVPITAENYKSTFTLSSPSEPLTVADWFRARAYSYVRCHPDGSARAVFVFNNMVPNGVYAVWGIFGDDKDGDGLRDFFAPLPFGGAPNVFTADDKGSATFARSLPFCPNTDPDMMTVEVTFHVDGVTYGAVPSISPVVSNGNSYLSTPTQITFNLGGLERAN